MPIPVNLPPIGYSNAIHYSRVSRLPIEDRFIAGIRDSYLDRFQEAGFSLQSDIGKSVQVQPEVFAMFLQYFEDLARIRASIATSNWRLSANPPTNQSLVAAYQLLKRLEAVAYRPSGVTTSAEGGMAIYFEHADHKYADIEILNSGQVLGVTSDRAVGEITPFTIPSSVEGYDKAIQRVREFFSPAA